MTTSYECLIDQRNGWGLYQLLVYIWITLSNIIQAGPLAYMVFAGMAPLPPQNGTNETVFLYNSAAKEFNLIGNRRWIIALMTSLFMISSSFGRLSIGLISDKFGRKVAVYVSVTAQTVFSVLLTFAPSWQVMTIFQIGLGWAIGAFLVAKGVLYSELTVQKWRLYSFFIGPPLGYLFLDALSYYGPNNWRFLSLLMITPVPFFIFMTVYPIQESPKWLIESDRTKEALVVLKRISHINKTEINFSHGDLLRHSPASKGTFLDLWRTKKLRVYLIILSYSCFCAGISYYGMIFNLGNVAGNVFTNFAIMYTLRMIANSALILIESTGKKIGRKFIHQFGMTCTFLSAVTAATAVGINQIYTNYIWLYRAPCIISVVCSGFLWTAISVYAAELFPTVVRGQAAGLAAFLGSIGNIVAPTLQLMFQIWMPLPYVLLSVLLGANIVAAQFCLPETKGKPLPEFESDKKSDSEIPETVL